MDYFARDIVGISAYDFYHGSDIAVIQSHHAKCMKIGQLTLLFVYWFSIVVFRYCIPVESGA